MRRKISRARASSSARVAPGSEVWPRSGLVMDGSLGFKDKRALLPRKRAGELTEPHTPGDDMRPSERLPDALRPVTLETGVNRYAEGSCLVSFGHTRVLVTASLEEGVPGFLRGKGQGWVTAEYGMLPRATHTRGRREAAQGKQSGDRKS